MSTTAKSLIIPATGKRTANDPDRLAGRPELVRVLSDYLRVLYVNVAKAFPEYFASSSAVVGASGVFAIPATAIVVFMVKNSDGDEVSIVPVTDTDADIPPRVYQLGRNLVTVAESGDPVATATLTLYYAMLHPELDPTEAWDHADNTLDDSWPERHNQLLIDMLARYLAHKGGRTEEEALLEKKVVAGEALLMAEAEAQATALRTRWAR